MHVFLSKVSMYGIGPELLLKLSKREKEVLKKLIDEEFKNGEIQPLKPFILPSATFNTEAISKMKADFAQNQKCVVLLDNTIQLNGATTNEFLCKQEKNYIILGDEHNLWFDLIQWFISRGGRKFTIITKQISSLLNRRFSVLLREQKSIEMNFKSLEVEEEIQKFISQISEEAKIGVIFVFGKKYFMTVEEILHHLHEAHVILIGESSEMAREWTSCSEKHSLIEVPHNTSGFSYILQNLDSLLNIDEPIIRMKKLPANGPSLDTSYLTHWQHLPDSVSSVVDLAKSSGEIQWKELRTKGPNHTQSREISPVFIIPPLRKGQLDKLVEGLFHPAFTAVIPLKVSSLQELANQLCQGLMKFNCNVFTIICADWSYKLGLEMGRILEKKGKIVSLIILDIHAVWTSLILKSIYDKAKKSISNDTFDNKTLGLFEKGFNTLKNRVELVYNSSLQIEPKLKGFLHLFVTKNVTKGTSYISDFCERPVKVHSMDCTDYLEMLNSPNMANEINTIVLVEHQDSAHFVSRDYENIKVVIQQDD